MLPMPSLNPESESPLYRQLADFIKGCVRDGILTRGQRLPATRELAAQLGLNRTTVAAAYEILETEGYLRGHVGKGSFVEIPGAAAGRDWERLLGPSYPWPAATTPEGCISFATSHPREDLFPLDDFRRSCEDVMRSAALSQLLQLGSPHGLPALRSYLLETHRAAGVVRSGDDILITSGCQQALDLVARLLIRAGDQVAIEQPSYPGLRSVFTRLGARLLALPVGAAGLEPASLRQALAIETPRLLVVTPNFQNPTGATLTLESRRELLEIAAGAGIILVEIDIYSALRYEGRPLPSLKAMDSRGDVIQLGSFSKITFPGLRVGWILAPRAVVARLVESKQIADLHTDQFSQAVLLRFAESGRLEQHRRRVVAEGARSLAAALEGLPRALPPGSSYTRPQGGLNLWVRLPEPLDPGELLAQAQREGVSYLPGSFFGGTLRDSGLRLSFGGLPAEQVRRGIGILGKVFTADWKRKRGAVLEPTPAMV